MKKISTFLFFVVVAISYSVCVAHAEDIYPIDLNERVQTGTHLSVRTSECISKPDNITIPLDESGFVGDERGSLILELDGETKDLILSNATGNEWILGFDLRSQDVNNPYPEIEQMNITIHILGMSGGRSQSFGKDYRVYLLEQSMLMPVNILSSDMNALEFQVDKLGMYVIYYDPAVYSVTFYADKPEYDADNNIISEEYYKLENLNMEDDVTFPEVPQNDGFVFRGWVHAHMQGSYFMTEYIKPQPITAFSTSLLYPLWCPEEEYAPLEITLSADEPIVRGEEDGKTLKLTLSEGKFAEDFPTQLEDYANPEYAEYQETILQEWKSYWNVVGSDELLIKSVERIDDRTVKLTLSGNSSEKYTTSDIQVEFNHSFYDSYDYDDENRSIYPVHDIQLDADGVMRNMFLSDNAIKLTRQNRPSRGLADVKYTVTFNTNGGTDIAEQSVTNNNVATEPPIPEKAGYIFAGWFVDPAYTTTYDFTAKVTKNIVLYAKWDAVENNQIILTIGKKDAEVFGERISNDVAPIIRNERTMLPIRFIAEAMGATVAWDATPPGIVTITKDDLEIIIYIGESYAVVNGESVTLDSPAFVENNRTYMPISFIAQKLGATVVWEEETQTVIITKNI